MPALDERFLVIFMFIIIQPKMATGILFLSFETFSSVGKICFIFQADCLCFGGNKHRVDSCHFVISRRSALRLFAINTIGTWSPYICFVLVCCVMAKSKRTGRSFEKDEIIALSRLITFRGRFGVWLVDSLSGQFGLFLISLTPPLRAMRRIRDHLLFPSKINSL